MSSIPRDVVQKLVAAHNGLNPVFLLAAVDFEVTPPPTNDERDEAHRLAVKDARRSSKDAAADGLPEAPVTTP